MKRGGRDEINAGIKAALGQLNGTEDAAVSLVTGLSAEEVEDLSEKGEGSETGAQG